MPCCADDRRSMALRRRQSVRSELDFGLPDRRRSVSAGSFLASETTPASGTTSHLAPARSAAVRCDPVDSLAICCPPNAQPSKSGVVVNAFRRRNDRTGRGVSIVAVPRFDETQLCRVGARHGRIPLGRSFSQQPTAGVVAVAGWRCEWRCHSLVRHRANAQLQRQALLDHSAGSGRNTVCCFRKSEPRSRLFEFVPGHRDRFVRLPGRARQRRALLGA